ncbi:MAG: transposase [Nitrospirales bacterium]|nr:MAG: transposase [Nitrospirales bacterium]
MPRKLRMIFPGLPHHVVQRGHNRKAVFVEDSDYQYYLDNLEEGKQRFAVKVYAYCLMTNHVHLVIEPTKETKSVSELMKLLAARQTRWVNKLERRSGSLWEGRYKVSPVCRDEYLLQVCRYVELNPVKAKMVREAASYRWSSYRRKVGLEEKGFLDFDAMYQSLSGNVSRRRKLYQRFVEVSKDEHSRLIEEALSRNQLTGGSQFRDEIELRFGIRVENRGRGRPRRK